ncbi:hypothetical protein D3C72_2559950 [compost metagenome]
MTAHSLTVSSVLITRSTSKEEMFSPRRRHVVSPSSTESATSRAGCDEKDPCSG